MSSVIAEQKEHNEMLQSKLGELRNGHRVRHTIYFHDGNTDVWDCAWYHMGRKELVSTYNYMPYNSLSECAEDHIKSLKISDDKIDKINHWECHVSGQKFIPLEDYKRPIAPSGCEFSKLVDEQIIRHKIHAKGQEFVFEGWYDAGDNIIIEDDDWIDKPHKTFKSFVKAHYKYVHVRYKIAEALECECLVNDKWIPVSEL